MQTHSDDFPFICTISGCDSRFKKKTALQYHLEKHKNQKFFCSVPGCQKSFSTLPHLKQHQSAKLYHDKIIPFSQNLAQKTSEPEKFLYREKERATCPKINPLRTECIKIDILKISIFGLEKEIILCK